MVYNISKSTSLRRLLSSSLLQNRNIVFYRPAHHSLLSDFNLKNSGYFVGKSSLLSISTYAGTTKPCLAPSKFGPKSTISSAYCSIYVDAPPGSHAINIPSTSFWATDLNAIPISSVVNSTSKPSSSSKSVTTFVDESSVSQLM